MDSAPNAERDHILYEPIDPKDVRFGYRAIGQVLLDSMQKYRNNICQIDAATGMAQTFEEIRIRSIRVALQMKAKGIKPGDVISICTQNHLDTCLPFLASFYIGARVASLESSLSKGDLSHLIKLVQPKMIFADNNAVEKIESCLDEINLIIPMVIFGKSKTHLSFVDFIKGDPQEDSFQAYELQDPKETVIIMFSSGTTGLPKGICLSNYGLLQQFLTFIRLRELNEETISLFYSPLYWLSAVMNILTTTMCGGIRIIAPPYTNENFFQIVDRYKVTLTFVSPTNISKLTDVPELFEIYDTSSLKSIMVGGSPITEQKLKRAQNLFQKSVVSNGYGMTELAGVVTSFYEDEVDLIYSKRVSVGRLAPGIACKVVDVETGKPLGPNQPGELRIKSPYVMNGYYNDPEKSRTAWDEEGWLKTGDIVYYDKDNCFYVQDRIKEMFKYQNWQVTPSELEAIIENHPSVEETVVIGLPDKADGEHPMAVIVKKIGYDTTAEEIISYVDGQVADCKRLRGGVRFMDNLPKTVSGKVNRRAARNMILNNLSSKLEN